MMVTTEPLYTECIGWPQYLVVPRKRAVIVFRSPFPCEVHLVKLSFPPELGDITRGLPTGSAAEPLNREITQEDPVPVWPFEEGPKRGYAFSPLHKGVPERLSRIPSCTNFSRW
jgi:hypothetical protein